jgi:hypothetical protein
MKSALDQVVAVMELAWREEVRRQWSAGRAEAREMIKNKM